MLVLIILLPLLIPLIVFWRVRLSDKRHYEQLLDQLLYFGDNSPYLRISVVVGERVSSDYIRHLLRQESVDYEIVVVAAFAKHRSELNELVHQFGLFKITYRPLGIYPAESVEALYRSHKRQYNRVVVVDCRPTLQFDLFQIGALVSSYNYNLQLRRARPLRDESIKRLLLLLASHNRNECFIAQTGRLDGVTLIRRNIALLGSLYAKSIRRENRCTIPFDIIQSNSFFKFHPPINVSESEQN